MFDKKFITTTNEVRPLRAFQLTLIYEMLINYIVNNSQIFNWLKQSTESPATNMVWLEDSKYVFHITKDSIDGKNFVSVVYGINDPDRDHGSFFLINTSRFNVDKIKSAYYPEEELNDLLKDADASCHFISVLQRKIFEYKAQ